MKTISMLCLVTHLTCWKITLWMNPFVSWVPFPFLSPVLHFLNLFFLQWQFSVLSPCTPIYLATVNISDKVYIPLCISHSPFYSFFILQCVWSHGDSITIFLSFHLIFLHRLCSFLCQYFLCFSLHILASGILSWYFHLEVFLIANSFFFFPLLNPSSSLFQPWTQPSVITLTVASTQESCQVDKYWYLPYHFTTTFPLMHLVGINQLLCLLWVPSVGTGPDLSLISNLLHISSRAQIQKRIWRRSRGQRTRRAWPRGKGDGRSSKARRGSLLYRRDSSSQTLTAGDSNLCLIATISSLGC